MGLCYSKVYKTTNKETGATSTVTSTAESQNSERRRRPRDIRSGGEIDEIHQEVVSRLVSNGSSEIASLYTQQGKKGTNQDAMLVLENFCSRSDTVLCGVFDGQGPFGHMVARRVRDMLPLSLSTQLKTTSWTKQSGSKPATCVDEEQWCELQSSEKDEKLLPEMYLPLKQALLKTCQQMDKELKMHPTINCFCSGTTSVTVIKQGADLVVGNIGDSRAVLATRDQDNVLIALQMTVNQQESRNVKAESLPYRMSLRLHVCGYQTLIHLV